MNITDAINIRRKITNARNIRRYLVFSGISSVKLDVESVSSCLRAKGFAPPDRLIIGERALTDGRCSQSIGVLSVQGYTRNFIDKRVNFEGSSLQGFAIEKRQKWSSVEDVVMLFELKELESQASPESFHRLP